MIIHPEGLYEFLTETTIIRPDDLVKPLTTPDLGGPGAPHRPTNWYTAYEAMPAWIGKTLLDMHKIKFPNNNEPYIQYFDIIRKVNTVR